MIFLIIAGFVAGFIDAVAGGGGLISLPALMALGLPPKLALGTNKAIGISTAIASSFRYWVSGTIEWRRVFPMALFAGLCSVLGAWVATQTSPEVLRPVILFGLILVALYVALKRRFGLTTQEAKKHAILWISLLSGGLGFYDGFFGPGTGTFLMMSFVLIGGAHLLKASANSRLINLGTNIGAIFLFASKGYVDFRLALPGAMAAFLGGVVGAQFALKGGAKAIRPVFILITWLMIGKVAWDLWS